MAGKRKSDKASKKDMLARNRKRGEVAQQYYEINAAYHGKEIERKPHGQDYVERTRSVRTGRVTKTTRVEIKSSETAPLSKLQKKTKLNKTNYKVKIIKPVMY